MTRFGRSLPSDQLDLAAGERVYPAKNQATGRIQGNSLLVP